MKTKILAFILFVVAPIMIVIGQTEVLSNKAVIEMFKAGLSKETITSKIETSTCKFDIQTTGLIALKKQGVPDDVINAMVNKGSSKLSQAISAKSPAGSKINIELLNYVHTYYNDTIKPLEKVLANVKTKTKAFGYGGTNFVLEIEGETSSIKLKPINTTAFIIKTGGETPPELLLYKLKKSNKKRQAVTTKLTLGGLQGSEGALTVNFSKIENGVFKIILSQPLEPGEYFFQNKASASNGTNSEVFAFSVI